MNPDENIIWLHNYVGKPTTHSKIPIGEGICGTAVAEGENANVPDVSAVDYYIVCDRRTKSEMVVLIRAGGAHRAPVPTYAGGGGRDREAKALATPGTSRANRRARDGQARGRAAR